MSVSGGGQSKLLQELQAVLDDGPQFQKRLQQLISERLSIEEARRDLHLAMQAKDAYEDAVHKQNEAAAILEQAKATATQQLTAARDEHDRLLKDAEVRHTQALSDAATALSDAQAEADRIVSDAQAKAVKITSDLEAAQAALQKNLSESVRKMREADARLADIQAREAAAEAAEQAAKEKVRRLMAAMES